MALSWGGRAETKGSTRHRGESRREKREENEAHIFVEVKLGLWVSIGLALHGDVVALLDRVSVDEDEGRRLRGIWIDREQVRVASR